VAAILRSDDGLGATILRRAIRLIQTPGPKLLPAKIFSRIRFSLASREGPANPARRCV
jgi:hypothetical protein